MLLLLSCNIAWKFMCIKLILCVFELQYYDIPNLQFLITLKMLFQHLHNSYQLIALLSPHACHPQHIQLTRLQDICSLLISDFQNLSCHYGSGSSQETVKILGRAELPDTPHASYMFVRTHFCRQSTFEYSCTNREAQSC